MKEETAEVAILVLASVALLALGVLVVLWFALMVKLLWWALWVPF